MLKVPKPLDPWRGQKKKRRITPGVLANYWTKNRLKQLRLRWRTWEWGDSILAKINSYPAPKPVTRWQIWLMASYLRIRRPRGFNQLAVMHSTWPGLDLRAKIESAIRRSHNYPRDNNSAKWAIPEKLPPKRKRRKPRKHKKTLKTKNAHKTKIRPTHVRSSPLEERNRQIVAARARGLVYREIGAQFGVTATTVGHICRYYEVYPFPNREGELMPQTQPNPDPMDDRNNGEEDSGNQQAPSISH